MGAIDRIQTMLETCSNGNRIFPPTILYNEGWMLRLIVDWFARNRVKNHPLCFSDNTGWYSEAQLPTAFRPKIKGDKFGESRTHADAVIGNIEIGNAGQVDLSILPGATHLVVLEAKMFSKLSPGIKHAQYYNQAVRNVACIAETLKRGNINPSDLSALGFYVIAPQSQIDNGIFKNYLTHDSIQKTGERRVNEYNEYDGSKEEWFQNWFLPTIQRIDVRAISWEELIETIRATDSSSSHEIKDFYAKCLEFNQPKEKKK